MLYTYGHNHKLLSMYICMYMQIDYLLLICIQIMDGGSGLAAPVLAGLVFLKVKLKFHFYKTQAIN